MLPIPQIEENPLPLCPIPVSPPDLDNKEDTSFDMKHIDPQDLEISPIPKMDNWDDTDPYPLAELGNESIPKVPKFPKIDNSLTDESTFNRG